MRTERFHQNLKGVILRFIPSLEIVLVVILIVYGALAEPSNGFAQKSADVSYSLKQIERLIEHYHEAQLVIGYELGEVDWSQRVLRTLAVGTHVILSPTGGWGEFDLEALAIEFAHSRSMCVDEWSPWSIDEGRCNSVNPDS